VADARNDLRQSNIQHPVSFGDLDASNHARLEHLSNAVDPLSTHEIERLLDHASESLEQVAGRKIPAADPARPYVLSDLKPANHATSRQPIDLLGEVEMDLCIELGRTLMRLDEVLQLRSGCVVALDKLAGDPVDVFANGKLIARGEVLVMNDNFCIRVTELVGA
jgi:flagellar motor switch protein FliN/FliY